MFQMKEELELASKTTNYNMNKIDLTDAPPDITVLNENFDITDSELNSHATAIADLQAGGGTANLEAKVGETSDVAGTSSTGTVFGKLNKLISDLVTHMSRWTATKAGYVDASISSRAPANTALSNSIWTNARASRIDNIHSELTNTLYGLPTQSQLFFKFIDSVLFTGRVPPNTTTVVTLDNIMFVPSKNDVQLHMRLSASSGNVNAVLKLDSYDHMYVNTDSHSYYFDRVVPIGVKIRSLKVIASNPSNQSVNLTVSVDESTMVQFLL